MKIKILYSHLNVSGTDYKARPSWFDFKKCFVNFLSTIGKTQDVEIHVVYDDTRGGVDQNWLYEYVSKNITIHIIEGGSMFNAAKEMYRIAKELSEDMGDKDLFYFMENDYLHVDGWVDKIKNLSMNYNLDGVYVSTYDHLDKYFLPSYNDLVSKIFVSQDHHWRTTPSTCGTYLVNKKTFLEDYNIHSGLEGDHNKWLHLTETKNRFVLSPIPGLSTHCMEGLLSPTIDWQKINN
jgi:hypothetical protein